MISSDLHDRRGYHRGCGPALAPSKAPSGASNVVSHATPPVPAFTRNGRRLGPVVLAGIKREGGVLWPEMVESWPADLTMVKLLTAMPAEGVAGMR